MKLHQFMSYSDQPGTAIIDARTEFESWWQEQDIRFTGDGGSFFQVSASLSHAGGINGSVSFIYCITVFDPRDE